MVSGNKKSNTFREVRVKLPGGRNSIHYKRKKPDFAKCGECGAKLQGVPRDVPYKIAKLSKSERKPTRPYGGNLCSKCTRAKIQAQVE